MFDASEHLQKLSEEGEPVAPAQGGQGNLGPSATAPAPLAPPGDTHAAPPRQMTVDVLLDDLPGSGTASGPVLPAPPDTSPAHLDLSDSEATPPPPAAPADADGAPFSTPAPTSLFATDVSPGAMDTSPGTSTSTSTSASRALARPSVQAASGEPAWYAQFRQAIGTKAAPSGDDDADDSAEELSFVREARHRAVWDSNAMRGLLGLIAVLLVGLLVLQVIVHQRDRIAAAQPQLRPLFEWLCRPFSCAVQPLRQIDAIVIDSSSFNRQGPDSYRLVVGLRNASPVPVAAPWLELTLTDASDQPVLRRVLSDRELGLAPAAVIAGGSEWSTTLTLTVTADSNTVRIAGYRLLAFYP